MTTTDQLTLGRLARDHQSADITVRRADDGKRVTLSFPASSATPVQRFFGTEVLDHAPKSIRTGRMDAGAAPLLFNHDWSDPVGMVTGARVEGGRLVVDAALFSTARAAEILAMVEGGLRNVSIGYEIHEMVEDVKRSTYTATDWEPLEVSIVTVPADPSVGIGRQADDTAKQVRVVRTVENPTAAPAVQQRSIAMSEQTTVAAGPSAAPSPRIEIVEDNTNRPSPVQLEQQRKQAVLNLCRANRLDERYAQHWISTGASLEVVAEELVKVLSERQADQSATFLDMPRAEVRRYSLMRALRAAANKSWDKAGLELECNTELSKRLNRLPRAETAFFVPLDKLMEGTGRRDMTVAGVSGSNYLVGTDNQAGSFIDLLRNSSVGLRMGVTRLPGLVGNLTIPKMTAGNTAYWLADETTQITESQPTLGQVSMTPKNVAALTELSHQLMTQSSPDAEQLVLSSIARDIALAVDVGILRGSGSAGQPQGIVSASGVGAFTGTSLASPGVLNAVSDVASANALNPGCGFVTTPTVASLLMDRPNVTSATDGTPLWQGRMEEGTIRSYRAVASNQMAAGTMLFGWWPSVVLGEWGVLELMTNPYSDFTRGLTAVRGWYTCDVAVRYGAAFSYASSIT